MSEFDLPRAREIMAAHGIPRGVSVAQLMERLAESAAERDRLREAAALAYRQLSNLHPCLSAMQHRHDRKWAWEARETLRLALRATNQGQEQ